MLLRRLVLEDFGLYRGVQEIDLTPRSTRGQVLPVILLGGKNGAGKSTIFEAILLCLYGRSALGDRVTQREYLEYLFQRIHRSSNGRASARAAITVEFDFVVAGVRHVYEAVRSWVARGGTVASTDVSLDLRQDGRPLEEVDRSHWDGFLRALIPPGLSRLFFFDGERIERLATRESGELGKAVKSLLNLDLIEKLTADLQIYLRKQARARATDEDAAEIDKLETLLANLTADVGRLEADREVFQSTHLDRIAGTIEELQGKLRVEGGAVAETRDRLVAERQALLVAVKEDEERLRALAGRTLPFALCPSVLRAVSESVATTSDRITPTGRRKLWSRTSAVLKRFAAGTLAGSEEIELGAREAGARVLRGELRRVLREAARASGADGVESLSVSEREQFASWIDAAFAEAAPEAGRIGKRLEGAIGRLQHIEAGLAHTPTDDPLADRIRELNEAHKELGRAEREAKLLDDALDRARRALLSVERQLEGLARRVEEDERAAVREQTVRRSQAALKQYLAVITEHKVGRLERELAECFEALCRKERFVGGVSIDRKSLDVTIVGRSGRAMSTRSLSAGERQLFAVALLWALGRTSGRPLPVVIDAPLARLDSDHRRLLVERYLPHASHQVLVLSTDTEVDRAALETLRPAVSRAYRLHYEQKDQVTTVASGYFWGEESDSQGPAGSILEGSR